MWTIFQNGYGLNGFLRGKLHTQNTHPRIYTNSNSNFWELIAGISINDASGITIWGINNADQNGGFRIRAKDGTNRNDLIGYPDGELYWGGHDLAGSTIVAKSISGNGYIKYVSGLIIQWGYSVSSETSEAITFPISFTISSPRVIAVPISGKADYVDYRNEIRGTGQTKFYINKSTAFRSFWFAIGY